MPGASLFGRRLAAVAADLGVVSWAGVLRTGAAGVTDVLRLGRVDAIVLGSTEAAADLRDGGREEGGLASGLTIDTGVRCALTGREVEAGVGAADARGGGCGCGCGCGWVKTCLGILIVPALGASRGG